MPGWFSPLDARVLVELDRLQRGHGGRGDLFEIGTSFGKSAILLGYLARPPDERLTVCDVFEHKQALDPESLMIINHWYADVSEKGFLQEYERFHEQPPDVIVGPSGGIDAEERAGTCRIVHVDGGHRYDVVRQDVATARTLLGPGGLVAFGNISTPHNPGVALAVWELVLGGEFVPLCITESKLYGTWDHDAVAWVTAGIDDWVDGPAGPGEGHPHPGRMGRAGGSSRSTALRCTPTSVVRIPDLGCDAGTRGRGVARLLTRRPEDGGRLAGPVEGQGGEVIPLLTEHIGGVLDEDPDHHGAEEAGHRGGARPAR